MATSFRRRPRAALSALLFAAPAAAQTQGGQELELSHPLIPADSPVEHGDPYYTPQETDVWADPAPLPHAQSMDGGARSGITAGAEQWNVGVPGPGRPGGPGLDVFDVPIDECGASVYRNEDGRLEVFAVGPDDTIYHKAQRTTRKPETWTNWTCLGGPTRSGPAVTRDPLGRLFLVVMFADGSYRFRSQHAKPKAGQGSTGESTTLGMSDWVSLSGKFSTKPEVVRDSEGFLHVFGRGLDQQLYHRYQMAYPEGPHTRVVRRVPHPSRLAPSPRHTSHSPPPPDSSPLSPLPSPLAHPLSPSWARDARRRGTRGCTWAGRSRRRRRRCSTTSR